MYSKILKFLLLVLFLGVVASHLVPDDMKLSKPLMIALHGGLLGVIMMLLMGGGGGQDKNFPVDKTSHSKWWIGGGD